MKSKLFACALALAAVLSATPSFALDRCEAEFRRGLQEMKEIFLRMTPACQKEVDLGDANEDKIKNVCSMSELSLALEMQSIEQSRLKPLCLDDSCTRLRARGVCVEGKPFSFYLKKFEL